MSDDELLALVGPDLRDDVARCAAAAGYRPVFADPRACRREWLNCLAVVLDPTVLAVVGAMPRRGAVVLAGVDEPSAGMWRRAMDLGVQGAVVLPADENRLVRMLSEVRAPRRHRAGAVAVVGAHGGAGASVLASAVALSAARGGASTLLVDLDELGPGADLLLGLEDAPGLRWQDLAVDSGAVAGSVLHRALPKVDEQLAVMTSRRDGRFGPGPDAVTAVIDAGRAGGDLIVIDVPRGEGPTIRVALDSVDLVVLLTTSTVPGCAAAQRVLGRLLDGGVRVELCVRGPSPGGLRAGQLADAVGLPLLAAYRPDPRLPGRLEVGRPRVTPRSPLGRAASAIVARLAAGERVAA